MTGLLTQVPRILVVDDSDVSLHTVKVHLADANFQVITTRSGEEALVTMEQIGLPHLALVDVNMPGGMDGFEFCDKMQCFSARI